MKCRNEIEALDKKILEYEKSLPVGLADGKMGYCIYLYNIGRITDDEEYTKKAESLTEEIFEQIKDTKVYDIKNGLAGIGLGIDYLVEKGFVEGDINNVLEDVDDILFKQLCNFFLNPNLNISSNPNSNKLYNSDFLYQLQLLYYFIVRLKKQKKNSENAYFFREVIINGINYISEKIHPSFLEEPVSFSLENTSILSLLVMSKCDELYKEKISRIMKELSLNILSKIPVLHANRLYLLYAMDRINKKIEIEGWNEHIKLLARESDIEHVIENELSDDIYFSNGLPAIYLLLSDLRDYFSPDHIDRHKKLIINKIEKSPLWNRLSADEDYLKQKSGLFSGYMGTSLLLHKTLQR